VGSWNMTVVGQGAHHNKEYDNDANLLFAEFVEKLKEADHNISLAQFTYGSCEVLASDPYYQNIISYPKAAA